MTPRALAPGIEEALSSRATLGAAARQHCLDHFEIGVVADAVAAGCGNSRAEQMSLDAQTAAAATMPDQRPLDGESNVVEAEAPHGARVGLSGFQPLTADVLALAMARRGLPADALRSTADGEPAPDVVVAAVDHNSLARLDELRAAMPAVAIVAVAPATGGPVGQAARRLRLAALVPRTAGMGRLAEVLEVVLSGGRVDRTGRTDANPLEGLTERELEVLRLVASGASNAEIGEALGISPHTGRTHVQNLMAKIGVRTRLAAGAAARRAGLMPRGGG